MLSVLIPTYNYDCTQLVNDLCTLFDTVDEDVEIIVGDDCSTRVDVSTALRTLNELPHCQCAPRNSCATYFLLLLQASSE